MESWPGMVIKHLLLKEAGAVRLKKKKQGKKNSLPMTLQLHKVAINN